VLRPSSRRAVLTGYAAGSLLGTSALLAVLSLANALIPAGVWPWAIIAVLLSLAALLVLRDWGKLSFRLPQNDNLIPRRVLEDSPGRAGFGFGARMSSGVHTHLPTGALYLGAIGVVLLPLGTSSTLVLLVVIATARVLALIATAQHESRLPTPLVLSSLSIGLVVAAGVSSAGVV